MKFYEGLRKCLAVGVLGFCMGRAGWLIGRASGSRARVS